MRHMGSLRNQLLAGLVALALIPVALDGGVVGAAEEAGNEGPPDSALPIVGEVLDRLRNGEDALERLEVGGHVEAVAEQAGWSPDELRTELAHDDSLHVDPDGWLVYVESEEAPVDLALEDSAQGSAGTGAAYTDAETFTLHSLPGSNKVMYLDFDGFANATTGETYTAFDLDGNRPCAVGTADPACFTTAELAAIRDIWARVAEAYSAFDVDVTSQDPGTAALYRSGGADTQYGARMIVGDGDGALATSCATPCVGLAYVGAYASSSPSLDPLGVVRVPNFFFPTSRNIGITAVHELGHNVGLSHTTLGEISEGLWAPWMRGSFLSGDSGASLQQFTETGPQDQYAVMAGLGIVPRTDEPSPVTEPAPTFVASGVISSPGDEDSFAFTVPSGAGPTTISVAPATRTSLDIAATLYDSTMTPVGSSDPVAARVDNDTTSGLDATINATLAPGDYTLVVDGTGLAGEYSDYGSIGTYTVTATTPLTDGVAVGSASVAEGDTGKPRLVTFPVVLPAPATSTVTVDYAIEADGSANGATLCVSTTTCQPAGDGDVRSRTGTLTFRPSATTGLTPTVKYVNALVYPDTLAEGDETFRVVLSNPVGVDLGRAIGVGTILDDDPTSGVVQVAIGDVSIVEGDAGVRATKANSAKLWVTLSEPATAPVTVTVTVSPGTATPATDFSFGSIRSVFPVTKTITFAPGQWKKPVTIGVFPDTVVEDDETVTATLSNPTGGPTIGRAMGTLTILDDD